MARARSPNYPAIGLAEAIDRARKVYHKEHTHKAAPEVVAKAMGYGGINGGSLSAISALKKYGLLEEAGKDLQISKDALTILVDPKESRERREAIYRAAFAPMLFADLQKQWGDTLPSDENIRSYLLKKGFTHTAVDAPIRAYRETVKLVTEEGSPYNDEEFEQKLEESAKMAEAGVPVGGSLPRSQSGQSTGAGANLMEVGAYPVSKSCTIRLLATGPYTRKGIEALVKQLQLNLDLDVFPDGAEGSEA